MGLLDVFNSEEGRLGIGLLAAAGPRPVAQSGFGDRLQDAFGAMDAFKQNKLRNKYLEQQMAGMSQSNALHAMQVEQMQREQNKAKFLEETAAKFAQPASPGSPAIPGITPIDGELPPELRVGSAAIPARPASFDMAGYMGAVMAKHPLDAIRMQQEARKAGQVKLAEGENIYDTTTGKPLFQSTPKQTDDLREYNYALQNGYKGSLLDWITAQKKAGAPSMTAINNVQAFEPFANKVQGEMGSALVKNFETLQSIPQTLQALDAAKENLAKAGNFVGSMGDQKLAIAKFFNNNLGTNIDPTGVKNAEALQAALFYNVMDNLKKMDASPSQQQQKVMQDAFGRLTTDPSALPLIMDFYRNQVLSKAIEHNRRVEGAENGPSKIKFPYDIRVKVPQTGGWSIEKVQ